MVIAFSVTHTHTRARAHDAVLHSVVLHSAGLHSAVLLPNTDHRHTCASKGGHRSAAFVCTLHAHRAPSIRTAHHYAARDTETIHTMAPVSSLTVYSTCAPRHTFQQTGIRVRTRL